MATYAFKTEPYAHQRRALKQLLRQGYGGALLLEPRCGKTKVTIDWLSVLHQQGKITHALIVCPNRVMDTWVREFATHCPRPVNLVVWDQAARKLGPPHSVTGVLNVVVVNFEAFATPGPKLPSGNRSTRAGRFKARQQLWKWRGSNQAAMVVDESHKIKSPSGKASNMIVGMGASFPYRLILTGTPITKAKRAFDVYMQWSFLNPERFADVPTVAEFKERYGVWTKENGFPQFLRSRNLPELHERMAADSVIVRRDQCFDLPPREDVVQYVDLTDRTRKLYDKMAEEMVVEIEAGVYAEAPIKLVQALRLSQLTSGFITDEHGELHRISFEKGNELEAIMTDRLEQDAKLVVAARYTADLDMAVELARGMDVSVWRISGGVTRRESDQAIRQFAQRDDGCVMVVQPAAASLGIDLSSAAHMVWLSHTPSWVDFSQCCDRIALSRTSTTFTHLVARRSVDEVLLSTLADDGDVGRAIMSRPRELINGHPLDLDASSRLRGMGTFKFKKGR